MLQIAFWGGLCTAVSDVLILCHVPLSWGRRMNTRDGRRLNGLVPLGTLLGLSCSGSFVNAGSGTEMQDVFLFRSEVEGRKVVKGAFDIVSYCVHSA